MTEDPIEEKLYNIYKKLSELEYKVSKIIRILEQKEREETYHDPIAF